MKCKIKNYNYFKRNEEFFNTNKKDKSEMIKNYKKKRKSEKEYKGENE